MSDFNESNAESPLLVEGEILRWSGIEGLSVENEREAKIVEYLESLQLSMGDPEAAQRRYEEEQRSRVMSQKKISTSPSNLLVRRQSILKL